MPVAHGEKVGQWQSLWPDVTAPRLCMLSKRRMQPPAVGEIPSISAYGRTVVAGDRTPANLAARRGGGIHIPSEDPSEKIRAAGSD
jgi:hypothetical protein